MVSVRAGSSICSGLCCGSVSHNAWPLMQDGLVACVTIDDRMANESVNCCKGMTCKLGHVALLHWLA